MDDGDPDAGPRARPTRAVGFGLAALSVWRLTHLVVFEDGPGQVVVRARQRAGSGFVGELMDCFYCASVWVALPFALRRSPRLPTWLALSGAACLLQRATNERGMR